MSKLSNTSGATYRWMEDMSQYVWRPMKFIIWRNNMANFTNCTTNVYHVGKFNIT